MKFRGLLNLFLPEKIAEPVSTFVRMGEGVSGGTFKNTPIYSVVVLFSKRVNLITTRYGLHLTRHGCQRLVITGNIRLLNYSSVVRCGRREFQWGAIGRTLTPG